jgi:hypothetical protein
VHLSLRQTNFSSASARIPLCRSSSPFSTAFFWQSHLRSDPEHLGVRRVQRRNWSSSRPLILVLAPPRSSTASNWWPVSVSSPLLISLLPALPTSSDVFALHFTVWFLRNATLLHALLSFFSILCFLLSFFLSFFLSVCVPLGCFVESAFALLRSVLFCRVRTADCGGGCALSVCLSVLSFSLLISLLSAAARFGSCYSMLARSLTDRSLARPLRLRCLLLLGRRRRRRRRNWCCTRCTLLLLLSLAHLYCLLACLLCSVRACVRVRRVRALLYGMGKSLIGNRRTHRLAQSSSNISNECRGKIFIALIFSQPVSYKAPPVTGFIARKLCG